MSDGRLDIKINGDNSGFKKSAKETENSIQGLVRTVKNFAKAWGVSFVIKQTIKAFSELTEAYKIQEQNLTKLNSINTAVGESVGYTTDELLKMAGELQKNSIFGDEIIMSAQQTLLTIGNLSQDTFNRAIQASADLASALGTDITDASQTLALALQDPEQGLRRLRTAGIAFTEVEKDQIQALKENGKEQEAHALVLAKVEEKYNGVAKSIANTDTGKLTQISNTWGDIKESLGGALLDTISPALDSIQKRLNKMAKWAEEAKQETAEKRAIKDIKKGKAEADAIDQEALEKRITNLKSSIGSLQDSLTKMPSQYHMSIQSTIKKNEQELAELEAILAKNKEITEVKEKQKVEEEKIIKAQKEQKQIEEDHFKSNKDVKEFLAVKGLNREQKAIEETKAKAEKLRAEMERLGTAFTFDGIETEEFAELGAVIDDCNLRLEELANKGKDTSGLLEDAFENTAEGLADAFEETGNILARTIEGTNKTVMDAVSEVSGMITNLINSIYSFQQQQSQYTIQNLQAELDAHLEAGNITQEQEKELTRTIQNEKRKQFEAEKKNSVSNALINGAVAITKLWAENPWYIAAALSALVGASTAMQIATINSQQFQGFEHGGIVGGSGITGDNHPIFANAGELILTHAQQGAIAGQLENQNAPVISINFNGQVFGNQEDISLYVYDGIRKAQNEGVLRQW